MKVIKILISVVLTVYFSASMFYCMIAGAPAVREGLVKYAAAAGAFSILMPAFLCACIHYISYLLKRLRDLEK